ncbi:MAG: AraC family transcriptional regulator [Bacillota bacterium]|nr:AraC family transcriptional regulator [Bacillota bacterium]
MLEEKAGYLKDFPINIRVLHIENYPLHYHFDPEFIYVLKGFVTLKCGSSIYKMQQGDIFVVNESEVHGIYHCSTDNVVLMIQIDTAYFSKMFPALKNSVYRTLSKDRNDENLVYLRSQLLHVTFNYLKRSPGYKIEDTNLMEDVITFMDKYFATFYFEGQTVMQRKYEKPDQTERLSRIISYLYEHHSDNITLKDLADMEYLSEYYISHLITDGTGLNFRELLAFARVEESEKLLLQSNEKVSAIAKKSGFSTTAYYIKFFKKWYMCEPEEYRRSYAGHIKGFDLKKTKEISTSKALDLVTELINFLSFESDEEVGVKFSYDEVNIDLRDAPEEPAVFGKPVELGGDYLRNKYIIYGSEFIAKTLGTELSEDIKPYVEGEGNYVWDSLATIPHLFYKFMDPGIDVIRENNHIDSGKFDTLLAGEKGIIISDEIAKPAFYGYRIFNSMKGEILSRGDQYLVTKGKSGRSDQISVFAFNYDDSIERLFEKGGNITRVQKTITAFRDSHTYKVTIKGLEPGTYEIIRTGQSHGDTIFSHAVMDNSRRHKHTEEEILTLDEATVPDTVIEHRYLNEDIQLDINLKGLSYYYVRIIKR